MTRANIDLRRVALTATALVVGLVAPIYAGILFLGVAARSWARADVAALVLLIVGFAWVNGHKTPSSDWLWYISHYQFISQNGLQAYFKLAEFSWSDGSISNVRPQSSEPLFYVLCLLTGWISGSSVAALATAVTILVYLPVGITAAAFARRLGERRDVVFAVVVAVACIGMSAMLTTHLVRQQLAVAYLFPFAYLLWRRSFVMALISAAVATGFHNSAMLFVGLISSAWFIANLKSHSLRILAIVGLSAVLPVLVWFLGGSARVQGSNDSSTLSLAAYAVDALLLVGLLLSSKRWPDSELFRTVTILAIFLVGLIFWSRDINILYVRFYFYGDLVRCLVLVLIVPGLVKAAPPAGVLLVVLAALIYADARLLSSPFEFNSSLLIPAWDGT